jgi:hypothetical protein
MYVCVLPGFLRDSIPGLTAGIQDYPGTGNNDFRIAGVEIPQILSIFSKITQFLRQKQNILLTE